MWVVQKSADGTEWGVTTEANLCLNPQLKRDTSGVPYYEVAHLDPHLFTHEQAAEFMHNLQKEFYWRTKEKGFWDLHAGEGMNYLWCVFAGAAITAISFFAGVYL